MSSEPQPAPVEAPAPAAGKEGRQIGWGVAVVAVLAVVALFWPADDGPQPVPEGTLIDAEGHPVELAERLTPVTLVHFWSTWCLPCLDEVPKVLRLDAAWGEDPERSVTMIAVADDRREVEAFVSRHTPDRRHILHDDWTLTKRFGTDRMPETHLVVDGLVVDTFVGVTDWDDPRVRARLQQAQAAARAPS